jgi:diacylglycerol kinase family enzyme
MAFLAYVTRGLLGGAWKVPGIELAHSERITCQYLRNSTTANTKIYVETDGELVGTLPAEITIVPNALTLLAPSR